MINDDGIIVCTASNQKFMVKKTVYTRLRKDCVVNLCPYIPVNDIDERSCYSTLLVHIPWPCGGEANILRGFNNAVECSYDLKLRENIPVYVNYALELLETSNVLRGNNGFNINESGEHSEEYLYTNSSDENNFLTDDSNLQQSGDNIIVPLNCEKDVANLRYCKNFIQNMQNNHLQELRSQNTRESIISNDEFLCGPTYTPVDNYIERLEKLNINVNKLTGQQLENNDTAESDIENNSPSNDDLPVSHIITAVNTNNKNILTVYILKFKYRKAKAANL